MTYTIKLLGAAGVGLAAAMANWISLTKVAQPIRFTAAVVDIQEGELIETKHLGYVEIPANRVGNLEQTAIPYEHRTKLSGRIAVRPIRKDDLMFWSDAPSRGAQMDWREGDESAIAVPLGNIKVPPLDVGGLVHFRILSEETGEIGPFRLLSVAKNRFAGSTYVNVDQVTVAIPTNRKPHHDALIKYIHRIVSGEDLQFAIRVVKPFASSRK